MNRNFWRTSCYGVSKENIASCLLSTDSGKMTALFLPVPAVPFIGAIGPSLPSLEGSD